ncbi:hypothetical protein SPRG_01183 [Saprolegnia parasitica CBS 223.65]|uniref:Uncharacterized protein n=1 Tax=Saprolegnia parasitica (strain CBS 223.65) TaxID=695850 RepID=A0A067D905_SAPPC|nr:hypothetical protein SPRG_01183 [Saprolegnia parasitica CBS 223.65]KDO35116.1 hypothetical protein SPRG_01183 [Saprolegnia parasitica CBS 223.65]|eukprot:XP_012194765.1 hypothetical protein SPRG_01183 [Saprolegnia parasitica CBS 223.65]
MSELAAILARRRAKDGTGEPAPETPAPEPAAASRPSPPRPFAVPSPEKPVDASDITAAHEDEHPARRTSSRIAQLQGNLGALNMNAFRPMPMARKSNTSSALSTGEDYDYESTMKVGVAMPGMAGVPMIGLTKPGIGLPGMMKAPSSEEEAAPGDAPQPTPVAHTTMTRAAGPKRRAPTKAKTELPIATPGIAASSAPLCATGPPGSSKSLFSDEIVSSPLAAKPAMAGPPRMNTALFGAGTKDNSDDSDWSDEDDDTKGGLFGAPHHAATLHAAPVVAPAPQATLVSAPAASLHAALQATLFSQPIAAEAPSLFGQPRPSALLGATSAPAPSRPNLFAASDSDDDSDDGGGLFGTGLPKK